MALELNFLDWLQNLHTPVGDFLMVLITRLGDAGAVWIALAVVLLLIPKTRRCGCIVAAALFAEVVLCNGTLKNLFARPRPFNVNTGVELLIKKPRDFSFPSGHTAASVSAVTALYLAKERKIALPALILAVLVAFSRMYLYVHYPTDILGGAAMGILCGYLGFFFIEGLKGRN